LAGLVLTRPVLPKDLKTDRRIIRFLRASNTEVGTRKHCALGILTVGDEGRLSRPRPVEIAVAFDDGTAISTLVNPQRDLADAREKYGISVHDVLLAPTLAEAWSVLGPVLDGATPVGVATDHTLSLIDFEFKRLGHVVPLPLGIDIRSDLLEPEETRGLTARTALARAQAALAAHTRLRLDDPGASAFDLLEGGAERTTYVLTRDPEVSPPSSAHLPVLSALLDVSREISAALLLGMTATQVQADIRPGARPSDDVALRALTAEQLAVVAARSTGVPAELIDRLAEVGALLGIETADLLAEFAQHTAGIGDVLVPGARICFTGTAHSPSGRPLEREEMDAIAASCGLVPVKNMTKTKCDVLVVAEVGTQSGKARKAVDFGKPVFSADEFFTWLVAAGHGAGL
jgi:hypothetical protein